MLDYKPYKIIGKSNTCHCNLNGDLSRNFKLAYKLSLFLSLDTKITNSYGLER